jgi:gentisate 1,2-dioxygenase
MSDPAVRFVDLSGAKSPEQERWTPVVIPKEQIEDQVKRLSQGPAPANGRRRALIAHPESKEPGLGLAPGIRVTLDVLLPGERTQPIRHNSAQVNFCIQGGGHTVVAGKTIRFTQYDVWIHPSLATYTHHNDTKDVQVRLTYSNAPVLEKLMIHYVDDAPPAEQPAESGAEHTAGDGEAAASRPAFPDMIRIDDDGSTLMSYERLINPEAVEQRPLHWPWARVKAELDKLAVLGKGYVGRRLYLLYNPSTGRTNGTTNNFFAAITIRPPSINDKPHRHSSAAINYFFGGTGKSVVDGKTYYWKAGDLMLTAPGWAIHNHSSNDEPVYELTIQDQPLNLAMDSLLWQEDLRHPPRLLGSHRGFATNRQVAAKP